MAEPAAIVQTWERLSRDLDLVVSTISGMPNVVFGGRTLITLMSDTCQYVQQHPTQPDAQAWLELVSTHKVDREGDLASSVFQVLSFKLMWVCSLTLPSFTRCVESVKSN